jgi:hypothetical protein
MKEAKTMVSQQGDVALLNHPVAQAMLHSRVQARLAYNWKDGTPRVIPIGFHWDGTDVVMGTPPIAPKVGVIDGKPVAITIDTNDMPCQVLMIRGIARVTMVDGIVPEYALAMKRYMGEEGGSAWLKQMEPMVTQMARIAVTPAWVGVIDFQTRLPSALEKAMSGG